MSLGLHQIARIKSNELLFLVDGEFINYGGKAFYKPLILQLQSNKMLGGSCLTQSHPKSRRLRYLNFSMLPYTLWSGVAGQQLAYLQVSAHRDFAAEAYSWRMPGYPAGNRTAHTWTPTAPAVQLPL